MKENKYDIIVTFSDKDIHCFSNRSIDTYNSMKIVMERDPKYSRWIEINKDDNMPMLINTRHIICITIREAIQ